MTINLTDSGNKDDPGIVMLHGLGADSQSWGFQVPLLVQSGYRVVTLDLPGFGRSDALERRWTFRRVNQKIIRLIRQLALVKPTVLGISMGGALAISLGLDYPEDIKRLVLVNTFASLRPQSRSEYQYFLKRGTAVFRSGPAQQANLVAERVFPYPEQAPYRKILIDNIRQADPRVYRRAMIEIVRMNRLRQLRRLHLPCLVISGAEDTTIPLGYQKRLAAAIPGAIHQIIPGGGHAVNVDQATAFNQTLLEFLHQTEPLLSGWPPDRLTDAGK